jgi:putative PEP-CTERM system histidine kinase
MDVFATVSYGAAALAFLVLAALSTVSWRGHATGMLFILASAVTAAWATVLAVHAWTEGVSLLLLYASEALRNVAWLLLLASIARPVAPSLVIIIARLVVPAILVLAPFLPMLLAFTPGAEFPDLLVSRAGLLAVLLGLILLEQIFRNSNQAARSALRYLAIGLGGMFAYDFFLYSQAELLRGIDPAVWSLRGLLTAASAPLIALALRRNPQWSVDIFVSRQIVFHSATFLVVGVYLLLMGLGGYYVRAIGGTWSVIVETAFLIGAAGMLAMLLFSASLRRRMRVFISKHFYRNKYDYRIEWLRFIETLSAERDQSIEHTAVRAVAQIFDSPGGVLFVLDEPGRRYVPAASWPIENSWPDSARELTAQDDLAQFLQQRRWILDIEEYRSEPEVYNNLQLPSWVADMPQLRIISPVIERERLSGFFLLMEPPAPFDLTYEDRDLLKTVGRHVATAIAQARAARQLAESRQFDAYNRLTAFLMHDLKNLIAQLSLVVANAEKHKHNPEFIDDAIATIANSVARMSRLIAQLRPGAARDELLGVDVATVVQGAISRCSARKPVPQLTEKVEQHRVLADPERLGMVIEHILRNAQEATHESGAVSVSASRQAQYVCLSVRDTGVGMDEHFLRERLFKPFDSTKGVKGMGIGAYQAREYLRTLGGDMEVESAVGAGTIVRMLLPVQTPAADARSPDESEIQGRSTPAMPWHATQLTGPPVQDSAHV